MALEPCYECGEKISTDAAACPHCGAGADSMQSHRRKKGVAWGIALLGVIAGVPTCVGGAVVVGFGITIVALIIACWIYYR